MLFDRFSRGGLRLANHVVRSSICEGLAAADGSPRPELADLYVELAKNGIGLILSGLISPAPDGCILRRGQCRLDTDLQISAYRSLTGAVHASGGRIAAQLGLAGSRSPDHPKPPAEWSASELEAIPETFAAAALRAHDAGFDAIQLHAAHGYLLSEFLTPATNLRQDAFGGSLLNRARLLLKSCSAVRRAVGNDFPILVKINSEDFIENGLSQEESAEVVKMLLQRGLSAVEISGGVPAAGSDFSPVRTGAAARPYYVEYAAQLRKEVAIPVILTGGIRSAETAEKLLQDRVCDLIGLGRPLIAEPDLVRRWIQTPSAEPSCCTGCNRCFRSIPRGHGALCMRKEGLT